MRTIRKGTFETNSSSMHSLVISGNYVSDYKWDKDFNCKFMDFSIRHLDIHTDPEEKFSYLWMVLCQGIEFSKSKKYIDYNKKLNYYYEHFPFVQGIERGQEADDFYEKNLKDDDRSYTKKEIELLKKEEFPRLQKVFDAMAKYYADLSNKGYLKKRALTLNFDDITLDIQEKYGHAFLGSKSDEYCSTGCYGNETIFAHFRMGKVVEEINKFIHGTDEEFNFDKIESPIRDMFDFAFDNDSVFIQNTDECDEYDRKKHFKTVTDYLVKNKGRATVIHPIGG